MGASGSSSSSSTLLVSPTNKISTVKWRTEVFKRLAKVFEALSSEHAAAAGKSKTSQGDIDHDVGNHDVVDERRGSPSTSTTPVRVDDIGASVVRVDDSDSFDFRLRDCLRRSGQPRSSSAGSTTTSTASSSGGVDAAALREFGETLVPLLIDSWVEASPADANLDARGRSKSVSEDVFDLFVAITSLLKVRGKAEGNRF